MTSDHQRGYNRSFTIRGLKPTTQPHKACPDCYADATSQDAGQLIQYQCPRGHQFTGQRSDGLNHAEYLARFTTTQDANR